MQGTVVMMMVLSGLGCHHKKCDVAYAPPAYSCFSGGCYANVYPADYGSTSYYSGCYSGCYGGCYSSGWGGCYGGCYSGSYGGHHGCGLFAKLFSCFKHSSCYGGCYSGCYGGGYGCYGGTIGGGYGALIRLRFLDTHCSTITGGWMPIKAHLAHTARRQRPRRRHLQCHLIRFRRPQHPRLRHPRQPRRRLRRRPRTQPTSCRRFPSRPPERRTSGASAAARPSVRCNPSLPERRARATNRAESDPFLAVFPAAKGTGFGFSASRPCPD